MNALDAVVLSIISGPTKRVTHTTTKTWLEGSDEPPQTSESTYETWEVVARVNKEWVGETKETFAGLPSKEAASKIIPGHTYHF